MPARCRLCPSTKLPIRGDGPLPCRVLCIGEGPGKVEDQKRFPDGTGTPFIGDSGNEFSNLYLPLAGLRRERVRVCNVASCANSSYSNPSDELAQCCSLYWLPEEIRRASPSIIITLGAISLRTLFPHLNLDLEHHHGIPIRTHVAEPYGPWSGILIPMYHPAAGLRSAQYMTMQLEDWAAIRPLIQGGAMDLVHDQFPSPSYQEAATIQDLDQYLSQCPDSYRPRVAMDTEYVDKGHPYCLSLSISPGTAVVVRATTTPVLVRLQRWLQDRRAHVELHYALADVTPLSLMGITLPSYSDTCMDAYHLGNLPIGLKLLAWRLCGIHMHEFEDVARPHALNRVLDWAASLAGQLSPSPCQVVDDDTKMSPSTTYVGPSSPYASPFTPEKGYLSIPQARKLYREWLECQPEILTLLQGHTLIPGSTPWDQTCAQVLVKTVNKLKTGNEGLARKLSRLLGDLAQDPDLNPWTRWKEWPDEDRDLCTRLAGPIPTLNITQVPWDQVIPYAARDADATLRVRGELTRLQRRFRVQAKEMS